MCVGHACAVCKRISNENRFQSLPVNEHLTRAFLFSLSLFRSGFNAASPFASTDVQIPAGLLLLSLVLPPPSYILIVIIASLIQQNIRVRNENIAERIVTKRTIFIQLRELGGSRRNR